MKKISIKEMTDTITGESEFVVALDCHESGQSVILSEGDDKNATIAEAHLELCALAETIKTLAAD